MTIKGIDILVEDEGTGAQANFHRIELYSVDVRSGQTTAHISGYVSEVKQLAGRNPLMQRSVTVYGVPDRGVDAQDWIYTELIKPVPEQPAGELLPGMPMPPMPGMRNVLVGGKLVADVVPVQP
jgi:hypothetical protein